MEEAIVKSQQEKTLKEDKPLKVTTCNGKPESDIEESKENNGLSQNCKKDVLTYEK